MKKYLFSIWVGALLGTISVVIGQIPTNIAVWSGLTVIGNQVGYVLAALFLSFRYSAKWRDSFYNAALALVTAPFVYYVLILFIHICNPHMLTPVSELVLSSVIDFIFWSIVSTVCTVLSASAIYFICHRNKLLKTGAFIVSFIGMIVVIVLGHVLRIINGLRFTDGIERRSLLRNGIVEILWAALYTIVLFAYIYRNVFTCRGFSTKND